MEATRKFNVTDMEIDRNYCYEFRRRKTSASEYGNCSEVMVIEDDCLLVTIDTRFDMAVMHDFAAWCKEWLVNNLISGCKFVTRYDKLDMMSDFSEWRKKWLADNLGCRFRVIELLSNLTD